MLGSDKGGVGVCCLVVGSLRWVAKEQTTPPKAHNPLGHVSRRWTGKGV